VRQWNRARLTNDDTFIVALSKSPDACRAPLIASLPSRARLGACQSLNQEGHGNHFQIKCLSERSSDSAVPCWLFCWLFRQEKRSACALIRSPRPYYTERAKLIAASCALARPRSARRPAMRRPVHSRTVTSSIGVPAAPASTCVTGSVRPPRSPSPAKAIKCAVRPARRSCTPLPDFGTTPDSDAG
jgi:hypothetical protein